MILSGKIDTSKSYFSKNGSFWTNNAQHIPRFLSDEQENITFVELSPGKVCRAFALIPFTISNDNFGLFLLKNMKKDHFISHEIKLYEGVAQTLGLATADRRAQAALRERVKELTCLYGIAQIAEKQESRLEDKLQSIVNLLPASWQHPDIAVARIDIDGQTYLTPGYRGGRYRQNADILVNGKKRGIVELSYIVGKLELAEGAFLNEEVSLIKEVARQVGAIIAREEGEHETMLLQNQLRHADRLATIGKFAAGVAHEINEPLGSILGFAQLARKNPSIPEQIKNDLNKIESSSLLAREIVRKLLIFARQMPTSKTKVNLNDIVSETSSFLQARISKNRVNLELNLKGTLSHIIADPVQMNQLLVNLMVNAIQAMPDGGVLSISTDDDDKEVTLSIDDSGIGMNAETKQQIFNPFYTTKDVNQGTGLGLSVVHGIITAHGGSIEVRSHIGKGTCFNVRLPISGIAVHKEGILT
ncbi:MAG: ATP-binding protein [Candidatus Electryonea clarkiae]|nr:ATP-binding protein [Candidatus Electryonea clarkiae]